VRYNYPKASSANYNELDVNVAYYFITGQLDYSNDVFGSGTNGTYYNIGFNYNLPPRYIFNFKDINLQGGIGHYSLSKISGLLSYDDYSLQISKTIGTYSFSLGWTGTNGKSETAPLDNDHLIVTIAVNF